MADNGYISPITLPDNGSGIKGGKLQNFILNYITITFVKYALFFYVAFLEVDN